MVAYVGPDDELYALLTLPPDINVISVVHQLLQTPGKENPMPAEQKAGWATGLVWTPRGR
jgi:hypothetical protein